jgi:hypothetical protein
MIFVHGDGGDGTGVIWKYFNRQASTPLNEKALSETFWTKKFTKGKCSLPHTPGFEWINRSTISLDRYGLVFLFLSCGRPHLLANSSYFFFIFLKTCIHLVDSQSIGWISFQRIHVGISFYPLYL